MLDVQTLAEQYGTAIYGLCRKLTANAFDADDLYQQTFLVAMGKKFRKDGNPRALLVSICIAQWRNDVRKHSRRQRIAPMAEFVPEQLSGGQDLEMQQERREQLAALRAAVSRLDDRLRLPVLLHYGVEMPVTEIAEVLHVPVGTVKSRLAAARDKLKRELEVAGYDG